VVAASGKLVVDQQIENDDEDDAKSEIRNPKQI